MSYDYELTHKNIIKSAEEHFKEKGFREASIRLICKDAGVTNGAFYAHFKSKEDLFDNLVAPCMEEFKKLYSEEEEVSYTINSSQDILRIFQQTHSSSDKLIHFLCQYREIFLLILDCSGGTSYENFQDTIIEEEANSMYTFLEHCRPFLKNPENISPNLIKMGASFLISTIFYSLKKGMTAEEILKEARVVSDFCIAGYKQLLGL
ncbi:MAG: TetR/AcrR family transcriptional regulator [Treponemataceae bacterium]|nr:TetR/AcrR family transcriptional regulator [Treponemataceae bacterium]